MQIIYLVLVLSVCKANAFLFGDPSCDKLKKGSAAFCTYFRNHLKHTGAPLDEVLCDCVEGVFTKNTRSKDNCIQFSNHLKDAPNCRDFIKSEAFAEIFNNDFFRGLAKTILTTFVSVCSSSLDQTQSNIGNIFTNPIVSISIGILVGFLDHGAQINLCYKEIRDLIT